MNSSRSAALIAVMFALACLLGIAWFTASAPPADALVVYCAHDLVYAEQFLYQFEQETGIPVVIVGDTEATKSLGLVQRLAREKDSPQCDVFWNNEVLGTMRLAEQGVLQPYRSPNADRIPAAFKDESGLWTGFGGRLRVWILDPEAVTEGTDPAAILEQGPQQVAIAEPMFGTTLTHYTALWHHWGPERLKRWHRQQEEAGVKFVPGNAVTKDLVVAGECTAGWTDTDDFFVAKDAGANVVMQPIRIEGKTICIPNSVAIIDGTDRLDAARQLVDFLLSERTELALAAARSRQIPLGTVNQPLPADVRPLAKWARESISMKPLLDARAKTLVWLKSSNQ